MSKTFPSLLLLGLLFGCVDEDEPDATSDDPLPPMAESCSDAVTGAWVGLQHSGGTWLRFTLRVRRVRPFSSKLTGMLTAHYWEGGPRVSSPPKCAESSADQFLAHQRAEGRISGDTLEFTGVEVIRIFEVCGTVERYYPDTFTGRISENGNEFIATSNDGKTTPQEVTFRRVECSDGLAETSSWWAQAVAQVKKVWGR